MLLQIKENGLHLAFQFDQGQPPLLAHWDVAPMTAEVVNNPNFYAIQTVQVSGESALWHQGLAIAGALPGCRREARNARS